MDILQERLERRQAVAIAILLFRLLDTAERENGLSPGLDGRHPCADVVVDVVLKMTLHLRGELVLQPFAAEQTAQAQNGRSNASHVGHYMARSVSARVTRVAWRAGMSDAIATSATSRTAATPQTIGSSRLTPTSRDRRTCIRPNPPAMPNTRPAPAMIRAPRSTCRRTTAVLAPSAIRMLYSARRDSAVKATTP